MTSPADMDKRVSRALETGRTVDITTTGRGSGRPRRLEIWFQNLDGRIYINGLLGQRDWYANLCADPEFVFHLKQTRRVDLPARARLVTDPSERRRVLGELLVRIGRAAEFDAWVHASPIIEVQFLDA